MFLSNCNQALYIVTENEDIIIIIILLFFKIMLNVYFTPSQTVAAAAASIKQTAWNSSIGFVPGWTKFLSLTTWNRPI